MIKSFLMALRRGGWLIAHEKEVRSLPVKDLSLGRKQEQFSRMLGLLLIKAHELGYQIRMGDVFAREGHKNNSFHYRKLAADINLFRAGVYLIKTEDHRDLGEYWVWLGGSWGGNFTNKDGNHYSYCEGK